MANPKHLELLKAAARDGADEWNNWRREHPDVRPDLSDTNLEGIDIHHVDLSRAILRKTFLARANLVSGNFEEADLEDTHWWGSHIPGANFARARLSGVNLWYVYAENANFRDACLEKAALLGADLMNAKLANANLRRASLGEAHFVNCELDGADISGAILFSTTFGNVDLSNVDGLASASHMRASTIGTDTIELTAAGLSSDSPNEKDVHAFLKGAGVPGYLIDQFRLRVGKPLEFYSAFISYTRTDIDQAFARRLYEELQKRGVRCWLDEHKIGPGDDIREQIDRGIKISEKMLLCASKDSLTSWWVDDEIEKALRKEESLSKKEGRAVRMIIPLDLDGYLLSDDYDGAYKSTLTRRLAADFTHWQEAEKFLHQLELLVGALRAGE